MTDAADARLVVLVESRAMLVATRVRSAMERRGFATLKPGVEAPLDGFTLVIRATGPMRCWIHPDHPDAVPDELGQILSQELRCRAISVAVMGEICAFEQAEGGTVVEKLAVRGAEVLEDAGSPLTEQVKEGASLAGLLRARGLDGMDVDFETARATRRAISISFAPRQARGEQDEIEIDPTLSCPNCKSAMRVMQGRFGPFYGCVRFPDCRGRLTQAQAEHQRS